METPKSRVYLKKDGKPEDSDFVKKHEADAVAERMITNPELIDSLKRVNFFLLRDIFKQHVARSGMPAQDINFIFPRRIQNVERLEADPTVKARYSGIDNTIIFYTARVKEAAAEAGISFDLMVLYLLVHEEGHAVSKNVIQGLKESYMGANMKSKLGYAETKTDDYFRRTMFYNMLEEGVNEMFTMQIFKQYLDRQVSFTPEETKKFREMIDKKDLRFSRYGLQVELANALTVRLAKETGLKKETVWQAMLRGKMEGLSFFDPELRGALAHVLSGELLNKLAKINSIEQQDELKEIIKEIRG